MSRALPDNCRQRQKILDTHGGHGRYYVGEITGGLFVPKGDAKSLVFGNTNLYAAQTFFTTDVGRRIRIAWNNSHIPDSCFNSSMSTPCDIFLNESEGLTLYAKPVEEFNSIVDSKTVAKSAVLKDGESISLDTCGKSQDITIKAYFTSNSKLNFSLFGLAFSLDSSNDSINFKDFSIPLFIKEDMAELRIITETCSAEIFVGGGKGLTAVKHIADYNLNSAELNAEGEVKLEEFKIRNLKSIWNK